MIFSNPLKVCLFQGSWRSRPISWLTSLCRLQGASSRSLHPFSKSSPCFPFAGHTSSLRTKLIIRRDGTECSSYLDLVRYGPKHPPGLPGEDIFTSCLLLIVYVFTRTLLPSACSRYTMSFYYNLCLFCYTDITASDEPFEGCQKCAIEFFVQGLG